MMLLTSVCAQVDYAWDEPMAAHRLRVMLDTDSTFRDVGTHEYNLDIIKVGLLLVCTGPGLHLGSDLR